MKSKDVHEEYHKKTNRQHKVINRKNFTYRIILEKVERYIDKKARILDIGCGAGTLSFYFSSNRHNIHGIDISSTAIDVCKISAKKMGLKNVTFATVNFPIEKPKGKYDAVFFFEVIEHLKNDELALEKIYKLLKPEGVLFLSTPSINAPLYRLGLTKKFDKEVGHVRRYELNILLKLIESRGFKVMEVKKTEGILRNFLFVNPIAGKFVRFIKFFLSDWVTFIDNVTIPIFGESNFIIVARKK